MRGPMTFSTKIDRGSGGNALQPRALRTRRQAYFSPRCRRLSVEEVTKVPKVFVRFAGDQNILPLSTEITKGRLSHL